MSKGNPIKEKRKTDGSCIEGDEKHLQIPSHCEEETEAQRDSKRFCHNKLSMLLAFYVTMLS